MAIAEYACADVRKAFGKPDAGNPHVRFDEGGGSHTRSSSTRLVLQPDANAVGDTLRRYHEGTKSTKIHMR